MSIDINTINSIEEVEALIAEQEAKKQEAYTEIGKLYYVKHSVDSEPDFKPYIDELVAASGTIAECNRRILVIKGAKSCPKCGAPVNEGSRFCTACGALLEEGAEIPAPAKETVTCSRCGSEMKKDMRFCTVCGNPMIDEIPVPAADVTKEYAPASEPDFAMQIPEPVPVPMPEPEPVPMPEPEPVPMPEPEPVPMPEPEPAPMPEQYYAPPTQAYVPPVSDPKPAVPSEPDPEKDRFAIPEPSIICPRCGKVSAPGMRFCVGCGTALIEEPAPAPAPEVQDFGVRRCRNCGHVSANPALPFCTECGSRLD